MAGGVAARPSLAALFVWYAGTRRWPIAAPFVAAWLCSPARRALGEPAAADAGRLAVSPSGCADAAADRAPHLALLRDLRDGGGPHAAARQLPGGPEAGRRAPDLADQHRPLPAVGGRRPRLRLDRNARDRRAAGGDARDHGAPRALPRPFLQLVRHARPAAARPALRLVGRQRQSRRPPDRARQRLSRSGSAAIRCRCAEQRRRHRRLRCDADPRGAARRSPTTGAPQIVTSPASSTTRSTPRRRSLAGPLADRARADGCDELARRSAGRPSSTSRATLAGERGRRPRAPTCSFWVGGRAAARSRAIGATLDARPPSSAAALERRLADASRRTAPRAWPTRWSSASCSTRTRQLLSIGYRVAEGTLDPSCYDLLASEARLASFVAIAKGDVPARHWFRLGRAVTPVGRGAALISWSGSMFEYLMPSLVMRAPAGSLLEQTSRLDRAPPDRHTAPRSACPGASRNRPTTRATSSSPTSTRTSACPASASSAASARTSSSRPTRRRSRRWSIRRPRRATSRAWPRSAARGRYGFYEALDYTPARLPEGETVAVVRAYMAHHQGMTMVAIANALHDGAMRTRFHAEPIDPGDRAAAAGAHAARRRGRPSARRGGQGRRHGRASLGPAGACAASTLRTTASPRDAAAVERPLRGDADRRGLGLQPLARSRRHALARGRHARRLGHATSSCATSRAARSGRRATSRAASSRTATR